MSISVNDALNEFYAKNNFGPIIGEREPPTVPVYTGCILVPLPNIDARRQYLKYHDLHHIITGFSVGRIGEGKMSAWELGTGTLYKKPLLGIMNLIALSTGFILKPKEMWQCFLLGCQSKNLYPQKVREAIEENCYETLSALESYAIRSKTDRIPRLVRKIEFACYVTLALAIHAVIAIPAVIRRFISDASKKGIREALKPETRKDIY